MSVLHFMPIYQVDVEIFPWIREDCDLLIALEEKSSRIHPLGTATLLKLIQKPNQHITEKRRKKMREINKLQKDNRGDPEVFGGLYCPPSWV